MSNDPAAPVKLKKTDDTLDAVFLQTSTMKESATHFGDVLLLDGTNRVTYIPFSAMVAVEKGSFLPRDC